MTPEQRALFIALIDADPQAAAWRGKSDHDQQLADWLNEPVNGGLSRAEVICGEGYRIPVGKGGVAFLRD